MGTILLVDDDPVMRELVAQLLRQEGYTCIEASDGYDGLAAARSEPLGLVLLDLSMPRLDGWGMIARLRSHPATRHLPVIAFTSEPFDQVSDSRLLEAGFDGYLSKGTEIERILHVVRTWTSPAKEKEGELSVMPVAE